MSSVNWQTCLEGVTWHCYGDLKLASLINGAANQNDFNEPITFSCASDSQLGRWEWLKNSHHLFECLKQQFPSDSKLRPSMTQIHHSPNFSWDWLIALVCAHQIWHFRELTFPKWPYWFSLSWMSSFSFLSLTKTVWTLESEGRGTKPLGRRLSFYLKNNSQMNREKENCLQLRWRLTLSPFIVKLQVFPLTLTCNSYSFTSI